MNCLHPIQEAVRAYLCLHDWFRQPRPIPIFTQDEGDLENRIQTALGALDGGLAVLIAVPSGLNPEPRSPRVCLDSTLEVRTLELPLINRSARGLGRTAHAVTRRLGAPFCGPYKGLHGWQPGPPCGALEFLEYGSERDVENGTWLVTAKFGFRELL